MMSILSLRKRSGIRKLSASIASPVAGAAIALYNITPGRLAIVRRVWWLNAAGANSTVFLGQGLGGLFVGLIPGILTLNGLDGQLSEWDFPNIEVQYTVALPAITFQSTVAGVTVQVEVEEIG